MASHRSNTAAGMPATSAVILRNAPTQLKAVMENRISGVRVSFRGGMAAVLVVGRHEARVYPAHIRRGERGCGEKLVVRAKHQAAGPPRTSPADKERRKTTIPAVRLHGREGADTRFE